jgi:Tfp pilus assembly protein PilF
VNVRACARALLPTLTAISLTTALCAGAGCASSRLTGPYAPMTEGSRDSLKAQRLTQEAAGLMEKDPKRAEALLREALTADLYHGPAHNNLGILFLKQDQLFSAAGEFEWARKLLPGHPDPRLNLALTLERAGRTEDALATYTSALEVYPDHLPSLQGLARLQLKSGKPDHRTEGALQEIALRGEDQRWREWARKELTKIED